MWCLWVAQYARIWRGETLGFESEWTCYNPNSQGGYNTPSKSYSRVRTHSRKGEGVLLVCLFVGIKLEQLHSASDGGRFVCLWRGLFVCLFVWGFGFWFLVCSRGGRNICSRHQWQNLPEVLGDPPTPPNILRKDSIFKFWRQNSNIQRQNSKIWRQSSWHQNSNTWRKNSNIWPQIDWFYYHVKIQFSVLIEMFVTSMSFRGTSNHFGTLPRSVRNPGTKCALTIYLTRLPKSVNSNKSILVPPKTSTLYEENSQPRQLVTTQPIIVFFVVHFGCGMLFWSDVFVCW